MTAFQLTATAADALHACGQIGGNIAIPVDTQWPCCRMCDSEMVAFLDLLLPHGGPFKADSRLQIFACRSHSDMAGTIYSDYTHFENAGRSQQLPEDYWNISDGHYCLRLLPPSDATSPARSEAQLTSQSIVARVLADEAADGFKLFGSPFWLQDPEEHTCTCGAPMSLFIQIQENDSFPMAEGAEQQTDSFSNTDYCLFLGSQLYLLACAKQCHPLALWPVLQG